MAVLTYPLSQRQYSKLPHVADVLSRPDLPALSTPVQQATSRRRHVASTSRLPTPFIRRSTVSRRSVVVADLWNNNGSGVMSSGEKRSQNIYSLQRVHSGERTQCHGSAIT